jgi:Ser/Thr protein kinase RdoA (MazF antagonist)
LSALEGNIGGHELATAYNQLTPDAVFDVVETGGRRCTGRFIILNSYENRVYSLELDDGVHVVGKFYRPGRWPVEAIEDEHDYLFELADVEIPVATPMTLEDGYTVGEVRGIYYALFPRIGGRSPQELTDEQVRILGRFVARMHNVGAAEDAPSRPSLTPDWYGRRNLEWLTENDAMDAGTLAVYTATVEALITRIEPLFNAVPMHRIHGDCHLGNLLWTPSGPTFLDFDDMLVGPAVQDVWMLLPSFDDHGARQRDIFLTAYREFRDFDPLWLRLVEPLRALRFIHYSTWIARRWHDPAFPRTFQYFGTLQYWQSEIQDLREQIARLDTIVY